jgi:hypothetical protein
MRVTLSFARDNLKEQFAHRAKIPDARRLDEIARHSIRSPRSLVREHDSARVLGAGVSLRSRPLAGG